MNKSAIAKATQAAANAIGKRYCSHHQGEVAADAGAYVMRNKTKRWVCFRCQEKSIAPLSKKAKSPA
jgi:hypothetical protein